MLDNKKEVISEKLIAKELRAIIRDKDIRTVFQPIINLKNARILGYEALSRGPKGTFFEDPLKMFSIAREYDMLFDLEKVCREKALHVARNLKEDDKLFINIDPHVIYDHNFQGGITKEFIDSLPISHENIVIELTEKTSIQDYNGFKAVLDHYKDQGYQIAIDDTGAGYSGLQSIIAISYDYIKLDHFLIRNIDQDPLKLALLEVFIKFSRKINSKIIAEGIETEDELNTLINMGIDYGQGYFIAPPTIKLKRDLGISKYIIDNNKIKKKSLIGVIIGELAKREITISEDTKTNKVVDIFEKHQNLQSLVVLKNNKAIGLIMRDRLYFRLGTKYGYSVFMDRAIKLIMDQNPLIVDFNTPIEEVSNQAMSRGFDDVYDCIIVTKNQKYSGIVSIRVLLDKFSKIKIEHAKNLNPLTNLPGNLIIEREVSERINNQEVFSVLYLDLDNFKSYNDCYGYKKGDEMIDFTARVLTEAVKLSGNKSDFVGHIGGDDFVIITTPEKDEIISQAIINRFDKEVKKFFNKRDIESSYIITKDRQGELSKTPLVSISIAIVSNKKRRIDSHLKVSDIAAEVKKYVKEKSGSNFMRDKRKG
ncbi:EAL domain-containing protein [Orenia marismortui]|uniref:Diguanylate cyclase (GGDEF)-like protein n=1 Tax=Orenia marismortui TaxID=46469 RepID=A0A4R8H0N9_9FIRM|nr:EAL domain-containing protein [Orenia marismortui]TDX52947.1 diguanylate cyclase (GGDEF)-like protein [Orenia marismortui]